MSAVYVLSNPSMPGLVKIGRTEGDPRWRAVELWRSGVPEPFVVEGICALEDRESAVRVERLMHLTFGERRVTPCREFFRVPAERVVTVLQLVGNVDIRPGDFPSYVSVRERAVRKKR